MTAKIKVAHIVHSFGTGGMEKGVATLISNASNDFDHTIICLTQSGASARLLPTNKKVVELQKTPGNSPRFLANLARVIKKVRPDVVHTRNWAGTDGILSACMAGIRSRVHSEHGFGSENQSGSNIKRIWIHRFLSLWVIEYICVSSTIETWLNRTVGVGKPVSRIYNGVDTQRYRPGSRDACKSELGIPGDAAVIGIVANLYPIKDHETLIRAFARLRTTTPNVYLVIVGYGQEESRLKSIAGKGVLFLGRRHDVDRLLRMFDVFVLCSRNEGLSNTILEAMATGLPVVASNVGGNPELVTDHRNGRLFTPGDINALTELLRGYLADPSKRRLHGMRGREAAIDHFSVQSMVQSYEAVWRRVARISSIQVKGPSTSRPLSFIR